MMIVASKNAYQALSRFLEYPCHGLEKEVDDCKRLLKGLHPQAEKLIHAFWTDVEEKKTTELEELFTRTFDVNPICTLEVGWQLFGEEYQRGEFLVTMRGLIRRLGLEESVELPDHLFHVLCVLGEMEDVEAKNFAKLYAIPAVEKMLEGYKDQTNPYENVLRAILSVLENNFE